jgi:aldehyde dehydrogenase (NAD+)
MLHRDDCRRESGMNASSFRSEVLQLLDALGVDAGVAGGGPLPVVSPIDGGTIAELVPHQAADVARMIGQALRAFAAWRTVPPPRRGELLRRFAESLRARKATLGRLVAIETGKILEEGLGEVQEMIDICDFAVGLSRQLYGRVIASERPRHKMIESWHPLGVCAILTAFNFPVAVWSWNAAIALVCGNSILWKPSEKTPLTALACQALLAREIAGLEGAPEGLAQTLVGGPEIGAALAEDPRIALVSATGSTHMGRALAPRIAARLGRSLLELGGNNAMIVAPSADLDLAVRAILFAAIGTAGQRCTTLRRLIVHESVRERLLPRLKRAYDGIRIGNPLDPDTLMGPLIDERAYRAMQQALAEARAAGAVITGGERVLAERWPDAYYVRPALVQVAGQIPVVCRETFAPILYVLAYREIEEAIALNNAVPQGLAASIFTNDLREAELFTSAEGGDCGIVNVNIGPSGAEIGGAFGGEKETGGGREAGSDAWKAYMRRMTTTINYSRELPLAQGIRFDAATA